MSKIWFNLKKLDFYNFLKIMFINPAACVCENSVIPVDLYTELKMIS